MEEGEPIDNPDDADEPDDLLEFENVDTQSDAMPLELQRPPGGRGRGQPAPVARRGRGSRGRRSRARSAPPATCMHPMAMVSKYC